jgi:drug/metabolite transporter (DMT)-like permease
LGASAWLVDGAWPSLLPTAVRQLLHDLIIAIVLGCVGWKKLFDCNLCGLPWIKLALASVLLLGVPATLAQLALGGVSEVTVAALFALAPVAVVILVSNSDFGGTARPGSIQLLVPALIGLAGTLFLLPVSAPGSWREARLEGVVVLAVLVAAVASVWMHRLLRGFAIIEAAVICCSANAVFFAAVFVASSVTAGSGVSAFWGGPWTARTLAIEAATAVFFDLPQVILLLWLLREITPARFSARYLVVPLLTVIEGYLLLRPEVSLLSILGAALLIFGVWRLMTASQREEEPGLMLR